MRILETERLVLRHLMLDDLDVLAALYADPDIRRYFPEGTLTYEETRAELEWFLHGHPEHPELGLWATVEKASGRLIGRCGLLPWTIDGRAEVEVAFLLEKPSWGKGFATEAARALVDYGFTTLGLARLVCLIEEGNSASVAVATRIGMTFEGAKADEHGPFLLYAINAPGTGGTMAA